MNTASQEVVEEIWALFPGLIFSNDPKIIAIGLQVQERKFNLPLFITSIDELTEKYPEFKFTESNGDIEMFHDLVKDSTPKGKKMSLDYVWDLLEPKINIELDHLLRINIALLFVLCVIPANRNKLLILDILAELFDETMFRGGGTTPRVKRVILMYHREGNVPYQTRTVIQPVVHPNSCESIVVEDTFVHDD